MTNTTETNEEIVLNDNQIICALTDAIKPAKSKELTLQSLIAMLNEEYGFEMSEAWR
jgi:type I restriction enzyme M protein